MNRTKTVQEWLELLNITEQEFLDKFEEMHDNPHLMTPNQIEEGKVRVIKAFLKEQPWAEREVFNDGGPSNV